ncbi:MULTISPECIES: hypothetical protein [unclassified Streptomyces]|uniref:hypothetical protein n=1 Tax=unclassified Streptomyces TaxID=2593676 RepID=UPI002741A7D7|nr:MULTISPECIES: hypothetical protein [unclassified Streptomyces]
MKRPALVRRPATRRALTGLAAWCLLYPLWFLFSGQADVATALWGAVAAGVAAAARQITVALGLSARRPRWRAVTALPSAARQTVVDFGIVVGVLVQSMVRGRRGPVGRFVRKETGLTGTPTSDVAATAAMLAVIATYSPNAYVIDIDPRDGRALLHDLRPVRASEEPL